MCICFMTKQSSQVEAECYGYVLRGCEGKYVSNKWENQDHVEKQLCNFSVVLKLTQQGR